MGTYTEIFFRAEVDLEAFGYLNTLINVNLQESSELAWPDHRFFHTTRFKYIATRESFYFPHANHALTEVIETGRETMYFVSFRANLKNYDDEISYFFDWVKPHCENAGNPEFPMFIGYSLYKDDNVPTLYYASKDGGEQS